MSKHLLVPLVMMLSLSSSAATQQAVPVASDEQACHALLDLPNLTITQAATRPASGSIPQYCYVRGIIAGRIGFHVQLPMRSAWSGRLLNIGDGSKDGTLSLANDRVAQGYAVANSNSGHDAGAEPGSTFAWDNRDALLDFGYRAVHLTANASKAVVRQYYGRAARHSYFDGCSTGGRQGAMEAQRFPEDFDGIVAGAPLLAYQAINAQEVAMTQKIFANKLAGNLAYDKDGDGIPDSLTKWEIVRDAVLAKCDGSDGIRDGVVGDPLSCSFKADVDLAKFACAGDVDADNCLTTLQIQIVNDLHRGTYDSKGVRVSKGYALGSEWHWSSRFVAHKGNNLSPSRLAVGDDHVQFLFYDVSPGRPAPEPGQPWRPPHTQYKTGAAPEFGWWDFNIDDLAAGKARFSSSVLDASDPDLSRFLKRENGRLLLYQGWADDVPAEPLVDYYKAMVEATFGGDGNAARERVRLFMLPGVGHCRGGPGPDTWDRLEAIVDWVENGRPPDHIVASRIVNGKVVDQRKVCAHPQRVVYSGPSGGENDPANWRQENFTCR